MSRLLTLFDSSKKNNARYRFERIRHNEFVLVNNKLNEKFEKLKCLKLNNSNPLIKLPQQYSPLIGGRSKSQLLGDFLYIGNNDEIF